MAEDFSNQGMLDIYLYENGQLLERLQEIVLEQKDEECFDEDGINEIFRAMHTIKGSSGVMMFDDITAVAHKLEDIFYVLREDHPDDVPHLQLVEHVLDVADFITNEFKSPFISCDKEKYFIVYNEYGIFSDPATELENKIIGYMHSQGKNNISLSDVGTFLASHNIKVTDYGYSKIRTLIKEKFTRLKIEKKNKKK